MKPFGEIYRRQSRTSGKSYIGYTTKTEAKRWDEHVGGAFGKDEQGNWESDTRLSKAIRKHGADDFVPSILGNGDSVSELKALEIQWIAKLGTFHNGYNMTTGGDGGDISQEVRDSISRSKKAQWQDPEWVEGYKRTMRKKGVWEDPERKEKCRQGAIQQNKDRKAREAADPEFARKYRAKCRRAAKKIHEARKKKREQNPEQAKLKNREVGFKAWKKRRADAAADPAIATKMRKDAAKAGAKTNTRRIIAEALTVYYGGEVLKRVVSEKTREKLRRAQTGKKYSAEARRKMGERFRLWWSNPANRERMSKIMKGVNKGRIVSAETRAKMSEVMTGKKASTEARAKMSAARKGKPGTMKGKKHSAETRAKISAATKGENNPFFGKRHSPEQRAKISAGIRAARKRREEK